jgi:nitrate/nitrite transporter NarK
LSTKTETRPFSTAAIREAFVVLPWASLRLSAAVAYLSVAAMLSFGPLLPLVREDFATSNTWAAALTSGTILTHTLLQMPAGQVVDSLGPRRSVMLSVTILGIGTVAGGLATDLVLLLASRLVVGVGTAIGFVAGLTVTNRLVPAEQRIMAQSIYGLGASLGVMTVLLFSQRLAEVGGWRGVLLAGGAAILVAGWFVATQLSERHMRVKATVLPWGEIVRERPLYLLGLAHVITYGIFTAVATWVVTFLYESFGLGLEWAGPLSALLAVAAILGRLTGGLFSTGRERELVIFSCALTAVSVLLMPLLPNVATALAALVVFGWAVSVPFGAIFAYISLLWGRAATGRELSAVNFVANLGALAFPLLVGYALDLSRSYALAFGLLAALGLLGTAAIGVWLPRLKNHGS